MKLLRVVIAVILAILLTSCGPSSAPPESQNSAKSTCTPSVVYHHNLNGFPLLNQTVNGTFFLASGQINARSVYWFYEQQTDGSFFLMEIPANKVLVYEEKDLAIPYVEFKEGRDQNKYLCVLDETTHPELMHIFRNPILSYTEWYTVHVPIGTVAYLLGGPDRP